MNAILRNVKKYVCLCAFGSISYFGLTLLAHAQENNNILNLYSGRHYQSDERLYSDFTKQTGIKIKRIDSEDAGIMERLKNEGKNSKADIILLTDAINLWKADNDGLFAPIKSTFLDEKIPNNLKSVKINNSNTWYGFSVRARVIIYNPNLIKENEVNSYEKLTNPSLKGKVCTRSASHPYMLSLVSSMIEQKGEKATLEWAKGMANNLARPPKGNDTDQIRSVASGECAVAIANSYYFARLARSDKPEFKEIINKISFAWPNQDTTGTHINIAGGGVAKYAPHKNAAIKFLEYLATDSAQRYFSDGNNEWPAVKSVKVENQVLNKLGNFKEQNIHISKLGANQAKAQKIVDMAGYK